MAREFLSLAMDSFMEARAGRHLEEGPRLFDYDVDSRTFWFGAAAVPELSRALGALLAQALLSGTRLQISFPPLLYGLLLRELGADVPAPGLADLALLRPGLAKGLQELMAYEKEDVAEVFPLDWPRQAELTSLNREAYVAAYVQWFLREKFAAQLNPLLDGFKRCLEPCVFLKAPVFIYPSPPSEQQIAGNQLY